MYKVYFLVSSPLPSTFSGSSDKQFSMCITISIVSLHLPPSQSPIPPGDTPRASLPPASWLHLSFAPPPSCQHPPETWVRAGGLSWHGRAGPQSWTPRGG